MSGTTIEKQTIYFHPPVSEWNHMGRYGARSQHLGSMGESKPSGTVDPSEPEQPLPAPTEPCLLEKQVGNMLSCVSEFPLRFFRDNC